MFFEKKTCSFFRKKVFSRCFWRKVPDSYSGQFFRHVRSTFLFICSATTTWTTDVQNILEMSETHPKQKNDVQSLENILRISFGYLGVFHLVFSALWDFFSKNFWIAPKGPPFNLATEWMLKKPKGSPFHNFKNVTLLSLRYSPDFGRSRLVYANPGFLPEGWEPPPELGWRAATVSEFELIRGSLWRFEELEFATGELPPCMAPCPTAPMCGGRGRPAEAPEEEEECFCCREERPELRFLLFSWGSVTMPPPCWS